MSGSLPTTPKPRSVQLTSQSPGIVTFSVSGRRQVKTNATQYWEIDLTYAPTKRADFGAIMGFVAKQQGQFETFTLTLPQYSDTSTGYTGSNPSSTAAAAIGASSVDYDGVTVSTQCVAIGDLIKFSGHNKVYMVTANSTSSGTGTGSIEFTPSLILPVAEDETVLVNSVPFTVFLDSPTTDFNMGMADVIGFSIKCREAV